MLYPAALLCYLPLSGFLRLRVKALCPLVLSVVTAFVLLGSAVCMRFQLKTNALLLRCCMSNPSNCRCPKRCSSFSPLPR